MENPRLRRLGLVAIAVAALLVAGAQSAQPADRSGAALDAIAKAVGTTSGVKYVYIDSPRPLATTVAYSTSAPSTFSPYFSSDAVDQLRRSILASQKVLVASRSRGGLASDAYTATLYADASAIERASTSDDEMVRYSLLSAADLDLQAKAETASASSAASASGNPLSSVTVTVDTVADDKPQPGYAVLFNPLVEYDATTARFPFPGLSSPCTSPLAPGWYVAWAQKGNAKTSSQRVHIGGPGIKAQHVQIDV
jgi:hypothetical protein